MKQQKKRKRIIIDTNFFFVPIKFQIDLFEELQKVMNSEFCPVVLSSTYSEVIRLQEKGSQEIKREARLAFELSKECCLVEVSQGSNEENDDVIVRIAKKWNCPVATNDIELRRRLRNDSIPTIYLRGKARLEIEGFVK